MYIYIYIYTVYYCTNYMNNSHTAYTHDNFWRKNVTLKIAWHITSEITRLVFFEHNIKQKI